jgi:glutamate decarboxylase
MPEALTSLTVARVVVRNGLSRDLAAGFVEDLTAHVHELESLRAPLPTPKRVAFHH